ncbi:group II intron reverse transcriptase/maturase [Thalassoporum mexicanum]|uniref:group II intron reverse transcriptase/maturase n=1 Tax=Thalassoporum mexicanum TaxID=3457544 RepID=UPI0039B6ED32
MQRRIYQASLRGDVKAVRKLQRLMMKSWYAKCLAVRRVTQDNWGKKTAGIDGLASLSPSARLALVGCLQLGDKAAPSRRVWIPKPGSAEQRPLSIPTMYDRALQALVKQALEPEWEAKFEPNSYGFRPGRSCRDAIGAIFLSIKQQPKYVLETDVAKCFDRINHQALCEKLNTSPSLTRQIRAWLKAGVMDGGQFQATPTGAAQGSVLSPLLANVALHGMEVAIQKAFPSDQCPKLVRYADDLVVIHKDLAVVQTSQQFLSEWLSGMGLELKPSKTRITHTLVLYEGRVGFDFLGYEVRQYLVGKTHSKQGFKTIIKPSREAQARHYRRIRALVKSHRAVSQADLIDHLNPIIRGWANYYSNVCSTTTYTSMDRLVYLKLWAWARRRHSHKSRQWIAHKYWLIGTREGWVFASRNEPDSIRLFKHTQTSIKRHVKVKGSRSPFDGDWSYWSQRVGHYPMVKPTVARLLKSQVGRCKHCGLYFLPDDLMEVHHMDKNQNNYRQDNLALIHRHCHHQIHARCV